jgi:hypothetical protein
MDWLVLVFALELGILPNNAWRIYDPPARVIEEPEFYQQLEARAILWDHVFAGGKMRIYDWMNAGSFGFWPNRGAFTFETGLTFRSLELGFRHYCTHPILPYLEYNPAAVEWEGGYEEIYLRLEGSTRR